MNIGIGKVRTKLLDTDHKQWNCGMGLFDPGVVYTLEDPNGNVVVDDKLSKIVSKSEYEKVYQKIGDKYYKTVKIGNLLWMCENLDYKWDGLEIGTNNILSMNTPVAAYRNNDEATWGWNGRKAGLYYNHIAVAEMVGEPWSDPPVPGVLPDGWRLPSDDEYDELMEYIKDENDVYRVDKLFVPECSWSPFSKPADAKMNETGLSLIPAGYYNSYEAQWSDLSTEHVATIGVSDGGSDGDFYILSAPTSSSYGEIGYVANSDPAPVRLVKDV
jgi:uncharacterized protein (TIGR02145 family)